MHTGAKWKRHVRVMLPMFKRAKIIQHIDLIVASTDRWIDRTFHPNDIHRDLLVPCRLLMTNLIGLVAFDYDFDRTNDPTIKKAFQCFLYQATMIMLLPGMPRWLIRLYLKLNWNYQRSYRNIRQLTEEIVAKVQSNPDRTENERPKNLIASLVSSLNENANDEQISSGLTRTEMLDEVLISILAGYETTSTALTWFIFYMSKHPHVQQRIKDELREHHLLGKDDLPIVTMENVERLVYCDAVINEVLRMAPIASVTTRIALQDTVVDGVKISKGETILIGLHNINTDPRYWHYGNAKEFLPERFLADDQHHPSHATLPFGGGHRACIGQDLARLELKLVAIRLMQRGITFEDTPGNLGGYEEQITCYPKKVAVRISFDHEKQ